MLSELSLTNQTLEGASPGNRSDISGLPAATTRRRRSSAARALGLTTVFWTDDPGDFQNPGDNLLETRFDRRLHPGGIVLLHDNAQETLSVFDAFMAFAKRRGVRLTTVSGLLADKRPAAAPLPGLKSGALGVDKPALATKLYFAAF